MLDRETQIQKKLQQQAKKEKEKQKKLEELKEDQVSCFQ